MIKSFVKSFLGKRGYKNQFVKELAKDPLNADLHLRYSNSAARRKDFYLAYAEAKTAISLGADYVDTKTYTSDIANNLPDNLNLSHNQYRRYKVLSSEITRIEKDAVSILDVGGGKGILAAFLPEKYSYCLAEPSVNGISGADLPFTDKSFDYVVSCHVLEHIPHEARYQFLDQLVSKARKGILLLNPFQVDDFNNDERFKLIIDITNAGWAKEHLECTLPKVNELEKYAAERNLAFSAKPDGMLSTGLACVFLDFYAGKVSDRRNWMKINKYFNEKFSDISPSDGNFTAYLVHLGLHGN